MAETLLAPAPALPLAPVYRADRRVLVAAAPQGLVLQVVARRGATVPADRLAALGDGGAHAVRSAGPDQWFVVGDAELAPAALRAATAELADVAAVFDQSHGRARILVSGPEAVDVLTTGVAVDLSERAFPVGASAATLFRHVSVLLTRTGANAFELLVLRSFAADLHHELVA